MLFRLWTRFVAWSLERFAARCARWEPGEMPKALRSAAVDVRYLADAERFYRTRGNTPGRD